MFDGGFKIMKKKLFILLTTVMVSCAFVQAAQCSDVEPMGEKTMYQDAASYASNMFGKVKNFFGGIEKITIHSKFFKKPKTLSNALWNAFFDLKLSYSDMLRLQSFKTNNQVLIDKLTNVTKKLLVEMTTPQDPGQEPSGQVIKKNIPNNIDTLIQKVSSNKQLNQSAKQIFDQVKGTIENVQNLLSNATKLFMFAAQKLEDKTEIFMKNLNKNFLEKMLKENLENKDIQSLIDFIETGTPERFCQAFANKPKIFLNILQEVLKIYNGKLEQYVSQS